MNRRLVVALSAAATAVGVVALRGGLMDLVFARVLGGTVSAAGDRLSGRAFVPTPVSSA